MSKPLTKERIIHRLSKKHGISKSEIEKAVDSQFKFVAKTMKEGEFKSVRLRLFGKFEVKPYRLKKMNEEDDKDK